MILVAVALALAVVRDPGHELRGAAAPGHHRDTNYSSSGRDRADRSPTERDSEEASRHGPLGVLGQA